MKTILTTDKAYVPYGYPRLNSQRGLDELYINSLSGDTINLFASVPLKLENIQTQTHSHILSINNVGEVFKMDVNSLVSEQITGGTFFDNSLLLTTNSGNTITIPNFNTFYNSDGELNFDRTVSLLDNSLTFSSLYNNNTLIIKNGNVGIGHSQPQTLLHVSNGQTGNMSKDQYESAVIENVSDTKFGIYTSADVFPTGGVSVLLGHSNIINNDGFYPGFEIQYYTPNEDPSSSLLRFNYTQREVNGVVQSFVVDLFKVESTGTVTINPNNNNTSIVTKPKLGIGTSTPRPNSILDLTATDSGLLLPRLSTTQRNSVIWTLLDAGTLIYNNTTNSLNYRNQNSWVDLTGIDNNIYITGGTFNDSTLSLFSNSGTTVNVSGFTSPPPAWSLTGNTGTTPTSDFIGTIDNQDLVFRTNNTERIRITSSGYTTTNTNGFGTDFLQLNLTPTNVGGSVGKMIWNNVDGTIDLGLKGGSVTLQLGQEQVLRGVNKSSIDLLESDYQVVKIVGATGQRVSIDLAQADNNLNSQTTIGVVTETILKNQEGFITTLGQVKEINTTGSLQGETWVDGDILYLSTSIAGGLTNVKPTSPNKIIRVGFVEYAHSNHGKIYVNVSLGKDLNDLNDVYVPTTIDKNVLYWNSGTTRYELTSIENILGYTPVPNTRTLTINGNTQTLENDGDWYIPDNNTFITGGTFNGSTLSLNSNSGTTVNITGFTSSSGWSLTGNTGTTPTSDFIGTIDNQDLVFRTNNFERVRILGGNEVGNGIQFNSQGSTPYLTFARLGNNGASINAGHNNELFLANSANGRVHIGTDALGNQTSALLQLRSTTRGFLLSRQTTTERNAISTPATGLQIYNTTTNTIDFNRGTTGSPSWQQLLHTAGGQTVTGQLIFNHSGSRFSPTIQLNGGGSGMGFWNTGANSFGMSVGNTHIVSVGQIGVLINPAGSGNLNVPTTNAALEIRSINSGFIPPKMTTANRDAVTWVSGDSGTIIYNTTTNKHQGYDGTTWNDLY